VKYTIPVVTLLTIVLFVGSMYSADAQHFTKIKYDGVDDYTEILAWSWSVSRSGTTHTGGGGSVDKASFSDVSLTKWVDKSTPKLLEAVVTGKHFETVDLYNDRLGQDKALIPYVHINMDKVIVTSISMGGGEGEDRLTENVSLNFAKFKYEYTEQDSKTGGGITHPFSWNIETNSP